MVVVKKGCREARKGTFSEKAMILSHYASGFSVLFQWNDAVISVG
jgi:hypothetical protein